MGDGHRAWDDLGYCKTFWIDGETEEAIARLTMEEWDARGRPPSSPVCVSWCRTLRVASWRVSRTTPHSSTFVATCLQRCYGIGAVFPPKEEVMASRDVSPGLG